MKRFGRRSVCKQKVIFGNLCSFIMCTKTIESRVESQSRRNRKKISETVSVNLFGQESFQFTEAKRKTTERNHEKS